MAIEVKMPNVGESVQEGVIHKWRVKSGDFVKRDDVLVELETDKATVEVVAENSGVIEVLKKQGETVAVGQVLAKIDTDAKAQAGSSSAKTDVPVASTAVPPPPPVVNTSTTLSVSTTSQDSKSLSPATRRAVDEHKIDVSGISGTGKDGRLT